MASRSHSKCDPQNFPPIAGQAEVSTNKRWHAHTHTPTDFSNNNPEKPQSKQRGWAQWLGVFFCMEQGAHIHSSDIWLVRRKICKAQH